MKTLYLDNNATTQVAPEVLEAMLPYFHELYGNPSSMHSFGGQVAKKIREAREQVAALIGATPDEIIFTSCGTESDNAAIRSALATHPERRHIVTSRVEHPAVRSLCANLAGQGYRVTELARGQERHPGHGTIRREPHARHGGGQLSCGPITKRGSSSPWRRPRRWPMNGASCSIPMRCSRPGRSRSTCGQTRSTCSPFPGTSSTPPRGSVCSTSARGPSSLPS